jgi:plasmid stability protein
MASVTIKDIPVEILERLRQRAAADHRSLNKEVC